MKFGYSAPPGGWYRYQTKFLVLTLQEDNVINELTAATANSSILEAGGFTSEYHMDILTNMKKREKDFLPKWNYMTKQPDITFTMRSILIDWLIGMIWISHQKIKFSLKIETPTKKFQFSAKKVL